jgi:hypothetical protein
VIVHQPAGSAGVLPPWFRHDAGPGDDSIPGHEIHQHLTGSRVGRGQPGPNDYQPQRLPPPPPPPEPVKVEISDAALDIPQAEPVDDHVDDRARKVEQFRQVPDSKR